jgi:hypothetical protein
MPDCRAVVADTKRELGRLYDNTAAASACDYASRTGLGNNGYDTLCWQFENTYNTISDDSCSLYSACRADYAIHTGSSNNAFRTDRPNHALHNDCDDHAPPFGGHETFCWQFENTFHTISDDTCTLPAGCACKLKVCSHDCGDPTVLQGKLRRNNARKVQECHS